MLTKIMLNHSKTIKYIHPCQSILSYRYIKSLFKSFSIYTMIGT